MFTNSIVHQFSQFVRLLVHSSINFISSSNFSLSHPSIDFNSLSVCSFIHPIHPLCPSVYSLVPPSINFINLSVCKFICLSLPSICPFSCSSIHCFVNLSICSFIHPSFLILSVCLAMASIC
jgi:hypothetical protein